MNKRKLLNGNEIEELPNPVTLTVYTKCPEKWMLIDTETGERYVGTNKQLKINEFNQNITKINTYVIWDKVV